MLYTAFWKTVEGAGVFLRAGFKPGGLIPLSRKTPEKSEKLREKKMNVQVEKISDSIDFFAVNCVFQKICDRTFLLNVSYLDFPAFFNL